MLKKYGVLLAVVWAQLFLSSGVSAADTVGEYWSHRFKSILDISYGEQERQKLDIYVQGSWQGPPKYLVAAPTPRPTFIYIHGGAWLGGKKESSLWSIMPFIQNGWQAVNIEYRVGAGTAPQAAEDVLSAIQWLAKNADKYAIDRNNIVISGDSAGGHLALLAGLVNSNSKSHPAYVGDKLKVKAIVNWFGISDIKEINTYLLKEKGASYAKRWAGSDTAVELISKKYSPVNFVNKNSAPVLSIHGSADKVVPISQTKKLHKILTSNKIENKIVELKDGRHLGFTDEQFQTIYKEIFLFLNDKITLKGGGE